MQPGGKDHFNKNAFENFAKEQNKQKNIEKIKNTILVLSGKGGVGKSTVSVNLAYYLASKGYKTAILDLDVHGPSIARMTGIEGKKLPFTEDGKPMPIQVKENLWVLSIASILPNPDEALIWRGPMITGVIKQFFDDFVWPEIDFMVVDNPPGTGDAPLTIVQQMPNKIDGAIIVTTPQEVSLLDARKAITFAKRVNVDVLGIIENMSYLICPHCEKEIEIFPRGNVERAAEDFHIDILGYVPLDPKVIEATDKGISYIEAYSDSLAASAFVSIGDKIVEKLKAKKEI